jgi:hypothetical protein
VLVDSRTDTKWFHRLCEIATAVAFPKGRIDFYSENVASRETPVYGSAFIYIGDYVDAFAKAFAGACLILPGPAAGGR